MLLVLSSSTAATPLARNKMKNIFNKITAFSITILFVILTAALTLAADSDQWRKDKLCGLQLPQLTETKLEGCIQAFCTELPNKARLCACQKSDETGETQISLEPQVGPKKQWNVDVLPPISFGVNSFRLDSADLNGDGKDELIFGILEAQGQGMGVQYWTLWVIDGDKLSKPLQVSDYGTMSYLTCNSKHKGVHLLASKWIWGREPERGDGLYIAAQWYELGCGGLSTVSNRPGIYHRYLNSLAEERGKHMGGEKLKPVPWHSKAGTHEVVGPYPF